MNQTIRTLLQCSLLTAVTLLAAAPAHAADAATTPVADDLWQRDQLLGDAGGLRPALARHGITLDLQDTEEVQRVTAGGLRRGGVYRGLTQLGLTVDSDKAFGLRGGQFFASVLQIHGPKNSFTEGRIGALQTASSIEARRDTRLQEFWWQQALGAHANVRVGQLAADSEFMVSEYGDAFMNAMFGWPALPSVDLPDGGPAYPLAALGVRGEWQTSDTLTLRAGLFDGYPGGHGEGDPQKYNRHGIQFGWHGKPLAIAELQYDTELAAPGGDKGLPGTYKVGAWHHFGRFDNLRWDTTGRSLADPAGTGIARSIRGDTSVYAMADQMVWRSAHSARSVGVFARAMAAPANRNLVNFSANAGLVVKAPLAARANDTLGLGLGYAHVSRHARGLARDLGAARAVRRGETFVEAAYTAQLAPWWTLTADAQYYLHPDAAAAAPGAFTRRTPNAWLFGLRTTITF